MTRKNYLGKEQETLLLGGLGKRSPQEERGINSGGRTPEAIPWHRCYVTDDSL